MRRVVITLLALLLVPSISAASWYRCMYDGAVRSACCCPTESPDDKEPAPDAAVKAVCCCTVIQSTTEPSAIRAVPPSKVDAPPPVMPAAVEIAPIAVARHVAIADRPRAHGDPPHLALFVRHCSLLL